MTESVLSVKGLSKHYDGFELNDVSFSLQPGAITGFIGRNGAGKSTTLKSLLNFVHPDSGDIRFFGEPFSQRELEIKGRIGFVAGGIDYYTKTKIRTITQVTRQFYPQWDDQAYRRYLRLFGLEERKTPAQLSEGMKVKYALTLALSHRATLLLLDEPTSGLDPVSREDLLDIFLQLVEQEQLTILFSTHITSDLEKCADEILYIKDGRLIGRGALDAFKAKYRVIHLASDQLTPALEPELIGCQRTRDGYSALVRAGRTGLPGTQTDADLESIMIHLEKEGSPCEKPAV